MKKVTLYLQLSSDIVLYTEIFNIFLTVSFDIFDPELE